MVEAYGGDLSTPLPVVVASRGSVWNSPREIGSNAPDFDSGLGHFEVALDTNASSAPEGSFWNRLAVGGLVGFAQGKERVSARNGVGGVSGGASSLGRVG